MSLCWILNGFHLRNVSISLSYRKRARGLSTYRFQSADIKLEQRERKSTKWVSNVWEIQSPFTFLHNIIALFFVTHSLSTLLFLNSCVLWVNQRLQSQTTNIACNQPRDSHLPTVNSVMDRWHVLIFLPADFFQLIPVR